MAFERHGVMRQWVLHDDVCRYLSRVAGQLEANEVNELSLRQQIHDLQQENERFKAALRQWQAEQSAARDPNAGVLWPPTSGPARRSPVPPMSPVPDGGRPTVDGWPLPRRRPVGREDWR